MAVIGAEGSPTCGINRVGRWKDPHKKGRFPDDIVFVEGRGVFMEEFQKTLSELKIKPAWLGFPGISLRQIQPECFSQALDEIRQAIRGK
jgi:hypothetical protein